MKTITDKKYDAVKAVRKQRDSYAESIKGMTSAEIIAYTKKMAEKSGITV